MFGFWSQTVSDINVHVPFSCVWGCVLKYIKCDSEPSIQIVTNATSCGHGHSSRLYEANSRHFSGTIYRISKMPQCLASAVFASDEIVSKRVAKTLLTCQSDSFHRKKKSHNHSLFTKTKKRKEAPCSSACVSSGSLPGSSDILFEQHINRDNVLCAVCHIAETIFSERYLGDLSKESYFCAAL